MARCRSSSGRTTWEASSMRRGPRSRSRCSAYPRVGACIRYAIDHPDRVARMILYGGYARGALRRGTPVRAALPRDGRSDARRLGTRQSDVPAGLHVTLHSRRQRGAAPVVQRSLPEDDIGGDSREAARSRATVDISASLADVRTPTLVVHAREDEVVPVAEGRIVASAIQGAEFVELDSRNHVLLEHEPAWQRFQEAVQSFVQRSAPTMTRCLRRCPLGSVRCCRS